MCLCGWQAKVELSALNSWSHDCIIRMSFICTQFELAFELKFEFEIKFTYIVCKKKQKGIQISQTAEVPSGWGTKYHSYYALCSVDLHISLCTEIKLFDLWSSSSNLSMPVPIQSQVASIFGEACGPPALYLFIFSSFILRFQSCKNSRDILSFMLGPQQITMCGVAESLYGNQIVGSDNCDREKHVKIFWSCDVICRSRGAGLGGSVRDTEIALSFWYCIALYLHLQSFRECH